MRPMTAGAAMFGATVCALIVLGVALGGPDVPGAAFLIVPGLLAFPIVGALLTARRPRNPVGWLFTLIGLGFAGSFALESYAERALVTDSGSLSPGVLAAWLADWSWLVWIGPMPLLLLLFPDGHLPSRRWRPVFGAILVWIALQWPPAALRPGPLSSSNSISNPFGLSELVALQPLFDAGQLGFPVTFILAAAGAVARIRRSRGIERQQLKWFMYAAGLVGGLTLVGLAFEAVKSLSTLDVTGPSDAWWLAFVASFGAIPIAAAIGILRYRLYDIDVLINRTLVYAAVSAVLAATYFAAVLLFQALLRPFTGGSELAVAGSTLLVVALFQPLRRRVQDLVDRRFYRSRYDAARTLDAFSARLRNEVELEAVRTDLLGVVGSTVRPTHASVWLRAASR